MLNNYKLSEIEKSIVQIECVNKYDQADKTLGTGFFVTPSLVVTASHVISKFYKSPTDYEILVNPILAGYQKIKVNILGGTQENNWIVFLELDIAIKSIKSMKFITGKRVERTDEFYTFGYPCLKRNTGFAISSSGLREVSQNQSKKIDWELNLTSERLDMYDGFSGAPVIVDNCVVGIIQSESTASGKAISLGMSSVEMMKNYIPHPYLDLYDTERIISSLKGTDGIRVKTINDVDQKLKESTQPSIGLDFFEVDDDDFIAKFNIDLHEDIYIEGKSREETIYCVLNELRGTKNEKNVIVVEDEISWEKLQGVLPGAIIIPMFYVGELVTIKDNVCIFVFGEDEFCTNKNKLKLKRRTRSTIINKLKNAGLDSNDAYMYVESTNGFFVHLKRKLFNGQYNIQPHWSKERNTSVITALLCGKWTDSIGDRKVIEDLSGKSYNEFLSDIITFTKGGEPLAIEIKGYGDKRFQLADVEVAWEYLEDKVTQDTWEKFGKKAGKVIKMIDPIFNLPTSEHYFKSLSADKPENSTVLKQGMIRSIILKTLYNEINYQYITDTFVKDLLESIDTVERWAYFSQFIIQLTEASPDAVMNRLEKEMHNSSGLKDLLAQGSDYSFTSRNYYTQIIWSIEQLLMYRDYAIRAIKILFEMDSWDLEYSMANSPRHTLSDIFCTWFNKYPLKVNEKIEILKYSMEEYRNTWEIIFNELPGKNTTVMSTGSKPRFRKYDECVKATKSDMTELNYAYANLCIDYLNSDIPKWLKIIEELPKFPKDIFTEVIGKLNNIIELIEDIDKEKIKTKIRKEIYRHRYFASSGWAMSEERLLLLEELLLSITMTDKVYEYLYFFNYENEIPLLNPVPYDKEDTSSRKFNNDQREILISEGLREIKKSKLSIKNLILLVNREFHSILGKNIAKYYSDGLFDNELFTELLTIKDIDLVIVSYIGHIYSTDKSFSLSDAIALSHGYEKNPDLYIRLLCIEKLDVHLQPLIMSEAENVQRLFWNCDRVRFDICKNIETILWTLQEFRRFDNLNSYIEVLFCNLNLLETETVLEYMLSCKNFSGNSRSDTMIKFYLEGIFSRLHLDYKDNIKIYIILMPIEMLFRNILDWSNMVCTQYLFKNDPVYYSEIVNIIYKHEGDEEESINDNGTVNNLFDFHMKAIFCPCSFDGKIDLAELRTWVDTFKSQLKKQKQLNLLGYLLGRLFAYSPVGSDDIYPHENIRVIIEELHDENLNRSYVTSVVNKRGVYTSDAGKTEMELSLKFKRNADNLRLKYSYTARIFDDLARQYKIDSERERRRAEDEN